VLPDASFFSLGDKKFGEFVQIAILPQLCLKKFVLFANFFIVINLV
jgi:hypothetical protein